jgi:anoctamin-7
MVPDIPEALELKIKREHYLAKQALADTDTLFAGVCIEKYANIN